MTIIEKEAAMAVSITMVYAIFENCVGLIEVDEITV